MPLKSTLAVVFAGVLSTTAQTVYMAGDSTMAAGGGGTGTDGWAQYLGQYLTLPIVNDAVAGRSARSYTDEGRFTTLYNTVKAGDFVIIEFGHNDGTSSPDNGRSDAVGDGYDTTAVVVDNGVSVVIHTYNYYIQNAIGNLTQRGAIPIVSSATPDNIWQANATMSFDGGRFQDYAQLAGSRTGVAYVDHFSYVAQAYNKLGESTVNTYYPLDHTHTSPTGANVVAEAFVRGLICGGSTLSTKVNSAGKAVPNGCL